MKAERKAPLPTVDIIIHDPARGVVLVERRFDPPGWALPGGFVEYGESVENAAVREAKEETNLDVTLTSLFGVYSDPARDRRGHTISTVFTARTADPTCIRGGDDAARAEFFRLDDLPGPIAFDHGTILDDFKRTLTGKG